MSDINEIFNNIKAIEFGGGSSPRFHPNYDIRQLPGVDYVIDLNKPLPIPDTIYNFVYSRYLLEHISYKNVANFIKETYRILTNEGKIELITSNLLEQANVLVTRDIMEGWNDELVGMIFGGQDYSENTHRCGFSPRYITKILIEIGFKNIEISPINSVFGPTDMVVKAVKSISEQRSISTTSRALQLITNVDRRKWILDRCSIDEKILDVGCADGWVFNGTPFRDSGNVTSIDLDKYDFKGFVQGDAHNLNRFKDKEFDTVILGEILEHVDNPVQVLKEAKRVGQRILITVPDEANWDKENYPYESIEDNMKRRGLTLEQVAKVSNPNAKELCSDNGYKHLWHNRHYTQDTLESDLQSAGINKYDMTKLRYGKPQWSFFTVDTGTEVTDIKAIEKEKLKIGLISTPFFTIPPSNYGGLEQVVYDLAIGLDELGHDVTIIAPEGSITPPHGHLITTGISCNTVGTNWFEEEKKRYNIYKDLITPEKFDVLIDHTWFGFIYLSKINNPKLKVAHVHHGGYSWSTLPPLKRGKPNLIAISKFMRDYTIGYFKQKGYNVGCEFIHHGIDLNRYSFQHSKTEHLLFVGRLSSFKRPDIAVKVARKAGYKLDIIGGSKFVDSEDYVRQLEKSVENDPDITIYKDVDHRFKIEKMKDAKAIIIPSQMNEPLNLVSLEGQACGTPIICSRDGGLPETVIDSKTGFVCDSVDAMIESIGKISTIKPEDCHKHIEENFSRLKMATEYDKLCRRILCNNEW